MTQQCVPPVIYDYSGHIGANVSRMEMPLAATRCAKNVATQAAVMSAHKKRKCLPAFIAMFFRVIGDPRPVHRSQKFRKPFIRVLIVS